MPNQKRRMVDFGAMTIRVQLIAVALLVCCACAKADQLAGMLLDPFGKPGVDVPLNANMVGATGAGRFEANPTNQFDPVGQFYLPSLQAGQYSMAFGYKNQWPRHFLFNATASPNAYFVVNMAPDYFTGTGEHFPDWKTEIAQQFMALGDNVVSASVLFAAFTTAQATIHQGDRNGPQIGPARIVEGTYTGDAVAKWSAGEAPTTPGQLYTLKIKKADNSSFSPVYASIKCLNGNDYPHGKTWVNGAEFPYALKTVIGMDTDGISTTLNTTNAPTQGVMEYISTVAGQTFVAKGSSLVGVNVYIDGYTGANEFEAVVFATSGINGMGATQIGIAKRFRAITYHYATATWTPGEAPLTAGQSYYIRIRKVNNGGFRIRRTNTNEYAGGQLQLGSSAVNFDISGFIAEEKTIGSAIRNRIILNPVQINNITGTSANVFFTCGPSSTAKVEYGMTPYTNIINSVAANTHNIPLTNLTPGKLYHVRVTVSASGWRDNFSRDIVFATPPDKPNLLANPGFESQLSGWTKNGTGGIDARNYPVSGSGSFFGAKANTGNWFLGSASNGGQIQGGAYQRVRVNPYFPVHALAKMWTWQDGNTNAGSAYMVRGFIGIDPTGGTNSSSSNLKWTPSASGQDWYTNPYASRYVDLYQTAMPTGEYVTVFLEAGAQTALAWTVWAFDDIHLYQEEPAPIPLSTPGQIQAVADNQYVSLTSIVVTASTTQAGANYLEAIDRSSGIRAESYQSFTPGAMVTVRGYAATKPSGERYIRDCFAATSFASTMPKALGSANDALGNSATNSGPGNVGLLMRTWGKVVSTHSGYFILSDGSLPAGIKVLTASSGTPPAVGVQVSVTGIVQLEGASPQSAVSVLRPRSAADITAL